jgi:hypothetical protein
MQPTNELRFVRREVNDTNMAKRTMTILQQKWVGEYRYFSKGRMSDGGPDRLVTLYERSEEWRDVPMVVE